MKKIVALMMISVAVISCKTGTDGIVEDTKRTDSLLKVIKFAMKFSELT